mgnify:CR=1 FL=1
MVTTVLESTRQVTIDVGERVKLTHGLVLANWVTFIRRLDQMLKELGGWYQLVTALAL